MVYKGKSLYVINESSLIDSFQDLLNDLNDLTYASYFCELTDIAMDDGESSRELFRYLATSFYLIRSHAVDFETLARTFELKILKATGYELNFDYCALCRKKITSFEYLHLQYSGGICRECDKENSIHISHSTCSALKYLSGISMENVYKVVLTKEVKEELYKVLTLVISQSYFRKPKSLDFLRNLISFEKNKV